MTCAAASDGGCRHAAPPSFRGKHLSNHRLASPTRWRRTLIALSLLAGIAAPVDARAETPGLTVERVVMLMRHGVRAPISGEVPVGTKAATPWPRWPVAPEVLTPHGAQALRDAARLDRRWLAAVGVVPPHGCPPADTVAIWTNTAERTIASGRAFAEGFAPGCPIAVGHQPAGTVDPLFEPLRAAVAPFDPAAAIASIEAYTGGVARQADRYRTVVGDLDRALGCGDARGCNPDRPATLRPSADGKAIELTGAIRDTSGTAQVLLLQYAEGLPGPRGGWPRDAAASLRHLGQLHAALFDVFSRPPYMAARQAGPLARRIAARFTAADAPRVELLAGHDTNVTALAAMLGVPLDAPGYARGDVAPGGALALALVRDASGRRFVRTSYRTTSPDALRHLRAERDVTALTIPGCDSGPQHSCPLDAFVALIGTRVVAESR